MCAEPITKRVEARWVEPHSSPLLLMRTPLRSLATLAMAVGVFSCSEGPNAPRKDIAGQGRFSFSAEFTPAAAAVYAQRGTFGAVNFDHVRIVLIRPPSDTVKDTTIVFNQSSPPKTLDLTVDVQSTGEVFTGVLDYTNNGAVVFHGETRLTSHPIDQPGPESEVIKLDYVGPGSTATRLVVSPKTITIQAPSGTTLSATAFDASNAAVNVPVTWSSSDATIAAVDANTGAVTAGGKRGTATISARTPTGLSDAATVTVVLPPTGITLVSGGGQTGKAGNTLAQPGVVRVVASDGIGVPGVTVVFGAPAAGAVSPASATTDANGLASMSMTLGSALGPQSFAASASGFSVSVGATATPGDPATVTAVSGSAQQDTVRRTLKAPFVVKVADKFGNGVNGVPVTWARTSGTGAVAAPTSTTSGDGLASMTYTLGPAGGVETVSATVSGLAGGATFTATALGAGPAAIAIVSGNGQSGRVAQTLSPFVVRVTDNEGNPVGGVTVNWSATNGAITAQTITDAQGQSSNTMRAGNTIGAASATATISTSAGAKTATFSATIQAGIVAQLVFKTPPSSGPPLTPITPAVQVELRDAAGNLTTAANPVTISLGANPGQATLSGTLTRTSVGGVATFDDLTINTNAAAYTLVASSAGVPSITSAPFDISGTPIIPAFIDVANVPQVIVNNVVWSPQPIVSLYQQNESPAPRPGVVVTVNIRELTEGNLNRTGRSAPRRTMMRSQAAPVLLNNTAVTNANGVATFSGLKYVGPTDIFIELEFTATVPGVGELTQMYIVDLAPGAPAGLSIFEGNGQTGFVGQQLEETLVAAIVDISGNFVYNDSTTTVTFTPAAGSGTVSPTGPVPTNGEGMAFARWTMPASPGPVSLTATATIGGIPRTVTFTATAVTPPP